MQESYRVVSSTELAFIFDSKKYAVSELLSASSFKLLIEIGTQLPSFDQ